MLQDTNASLSDSWRRCSPHHHHGAAPPPHHVLLLWVNRERHRDSRRLRLGTCPLPAWGAILSLLPKPSNKQCPQTPAIGKRVQGHVQEIISAVCYHDSLLDSGPKAMFTLYDSSFAQTMKPPSFTPSAQDTLLWLVPAFTDSASASLLRKHLPANPG